MQSAEHTALLWSLIVHGSIDPAAPRHSGMSGCVSGVVTDRLAHTHTHTVTHKHVTELKMHANYARLCTQSNPDQHLSAQIHKHKHTIHIRTHKHIQRYTHTY